MKVKLSLGLVWLAVLVAFMSQYIYGIFIGEPVSEQISGVWWADWVPGLSLFVGGLDRVLSWAFAFVIVALVYFVFWRKKSR